MTYFPVACTIAKLHYDRSSVIVQATGDFGIGAFQKIMLE